MSVALSIAFTGLCALIGGGGGKPGQVLLLDAKGVGEVGGVTLPAHSPTLVVSLNDLANPDSSGPTRVIAGAPGPSGRVEQVGLWDLTGSEVRIRPQGGEAPGVTFFRPSLAETSWPEAPRDVQDPAAWRDIRYVANMKALVGDDRVDPALIGNGGAETGGLPRAVAARIHLDAGLLAGGIPSQASYRDDIFEFRSGGSRRGAPQPLTDTVHWTLESDSAAVVIEITPLSGGPAKRLLLAPSAAPHRVFVSNLPAQNQSNASTHHAMSDEEMSALHFAAYYKLLLNEPADRPLPELSHQRTGPKGAGLGRPSFCPAAVFSQP